MLDKRHRNLDGGFAKHNCRGLQCGDARISEVLDLGRQPGEDGKWIAIVFVVQDRNR
jgi:hypothetical protein